MPKVSIIVPVYNAEKYLGEAIESVLKQTYSDFELLLINDASTDRSKEICVDYCKQDNRLIYMENDSEIHGPGPTRNIGLDHAIGDYIYFMDADDWIDDHLLECSVNRMLETNADIVQFGISIEQKNGETPLDFCWSGKDSLTRKEIQEEIIHFLQENRSSLYLQFFRRETLKSIRFENIISGEDFSYVMDALCNLRKIAYLKKVFYHYRYVEGSISRRWNPESVECLGIIWKHQRAFLDSFQGNVDKLAYAEAAYDKYLWAIIQLITNVCPLSFREKRKELQKLSDTIGFEKYRGIYPLNRQRGVEKVKYMLIKYHFEGLILRFGPLFLRIIRGE